MRCNVNLQAVAKALKLVERQQGRSSDDVQNQGRVDYVKVADWGSGRPDELGDLKLAAPPQELTSQMPFYEQLARHLEVLQSEGLLNVARPEGAAPLPPFQRWAFAEAHYRQHLADLLSVHAALESLSARILEQLEASAAQGGHESKAMAEAFALLVGPATGLARAECIAKDLAALGDGGGSTAPGPNAAQYARYLKDLAERCKTGFETEAELCEVAAR